MKLDALKALQISRRNTGKRFPNQEDSRFEDGLLFPSLDPKFVLSAPAKVFTIGSCFARNIEIAMEDYDIELPTQKFSVPETEWQFRPNGLLNQYNPGTTSQRIISAVDSKNEPEETIVETKDGFLDLLLPGGFPVSFERAIARRSEIDEVYKDMVSSDLVVITLGLIEAWFDEVSGIFLNRMPPAQHIKAQPERYTFHRLDVDEAFPLLDEAIRKLVGAGVDKILLTVSPVPLGTTFAGGDSVVANSFSKAVLRVCAEKLKQEHPQVDYYPSFELVSSGGLGSFNPDNIHVKPSVVKRATGHMLKAYFPDIVKSHENTRDTAKSEAGT